MLRVTAAELEELWLIKEAEAVLVLGMRGGQEGSPHQGEGRTTEELLCKIE